MLTKALIAALAAIALAVAAPAAGAATATPRPAAGASTAAHAATPACAGITRTGNIRGAGEGGTDTDRDGPDRVPDDDVDSPIDSDPGTDTDAGSVPDEPGESDPGEDPDLGECEQ